MLQVELGPSDEIFNNYGEKSNGEMLWSYGFCYENNPMDTVPINLAVRAPHPPATATSCLRLRHRPPPRMRAVAPRAGLPLSHQ